MARAKLRTLKLIEKVERIHIPLKPDLWRGPEPTPDDAGLEPPSQSVARRKAIEADEKDIMDGMNNGDITPTGAWG